MKTPNTLQEAIQHFSDFENCREFMIAVRWPDGIVRCPTCNSEKVTYLQKARLYKCYTDHPRAKFSLKVGTVFEDSPIALEKWLPAFWLVVNCKNGVSSWEVHRALGVTQKTAWFMLHRIRLGMKSPHYGDDKLGGEGGGPVEVDETFVGGKLINMHHDKKVRYERRGGAHGKAVVMGMLDRELRQVRANVVPNVKRETLQAEILNEVHHGSKIYTDEHVGYDRLCEQEFVHDVVNKVEGYVRGAVHVNGIENFWALFKRTLKGTYVAVEPFHLQRYADEQAFRYNNRATKYNPLNDADRFTLALSQIVGKRLTYDELTGKTVERPL
jgi:transposase-like protein